MKKLMQKLKKIRKPIYDFFWCTAVPFLIPFVLEIEDSLVTKKGRVIIVIVATTIDLVIIFITTFRKEINKNEAYIQSSIRHAYSGAYEIIDDKRDGLSHGTERTLNVSHEPFPYDVEQHIGDICKEFKKVIARITNISSEYLSATFIYRYNCIDYNEDDKKWKYLAGKEPTTKYHLNEFVEKEGTTYYAIVHDKKRYVFGDSKKELANRGLYHFSERDKAYDKIGSIFSILVAFGNNETNLVEGIITVSTHGKRFTEELNLFNAENTLRDMIIREIFPYYRRLLEHELGVMYIKHEHKKSIKIERIKDSDL